MKVLSWLDKHMEEAFLVVMLVLIACVSMLQVIVRKIPGMQSLTWAEEFCRFMWIWSVFISLPYTIRMENMLRVGVLKDLLPDTLKKVVNLVVDVITMVSMFYLGYFSIKVYNNIALSKEISPAMQWSMAGVYVFMVIGFFLAAFRGIQMIIIHVKSFHEKELTTLEQTMQDAAKEAAMAQEGDGK